MKIKKREKSKTAIESSRRAYITVDELKDSVVYGVYCHLLNRFNCDFLPATGYEIKKWANQIRDMGAVTFWESSREFPTDAFTLVKSPVDSGYFIVSRYSGDYVSLVKLKQKQTLTLRRNKHEKQVHTGSPRRLCIRRATGL